MYSYAPSDGLNSHYSARLSYWAHTGQASDATAMGRGITTGGIGVACLAGQPSRSQPRQAGVAVAAGGEFALGGTGVANVASVVGQSLDQRSLLVSGCSDDIVGIVARGRFLPHAENHGKTAWRRTEQRSGMGGNNGMDVHIYFWDDRDGLALRGWWVAPKIGGDAVWAYNPGLGSSVPPKTGWRVPYSGPVDASFLVEPEAPCHKRVLGSYESEVQRRDVKPRQALSDRGLADRGIAARRLTNCVLTARGRPERVPPPHCVAPQRVPPPRRQTRAAAAAELQEAAAELAAAMDTVEALVAMAEEVAGGGEAGGAVVAAGELEATLDDAHSVLGPLRGLVEKFADHGASPLAEDAAAQAGGFRARLASFDARLDAVVARLGPTAA